MAWIGMEQVYGALAQNAGFVAHFAEALAFIWAHGVDAALKRYIEKKREFRPR
jgi:mannitol 2-dehydrogenase